MLTKIFRSYHGGPSRWDTLVKRLVESGIKVFHEPSKCDHAIVLCGRFENPLALRAKRTLIFHQDDWKPYGIWELYKNILCEYYDDMIDVTQMSFNQAFDICLKTANS